MITIKKQSSPSSTALLLWSSSARIAHNNQWITLQKSAKNKQVQPQYDCYNSIRLISFRIHNNINIELAFGKHTRKRTHKLCRTKNKSKQLNQYSNAVCGCFLCLFLLFFLFSILTSTEVLLQPQHSI